MHGVRLVALDEQRLVPVATHELSELVLADPRGDRRVRDFVAVQMQDRHHRTVRHRIQELVRMPARS
jgi:hypothetical protein